MTDYRARHNVLKIKNGASSWKTMFVVFTAVILLFAAVNGLVKARGLADNSRKSWDGVSSFVTAINGPEDYLAIFQKEPKRIAIIKLGNIFGEETESSEMLKSLSGDAGVVVNNYVSSGSVEDITVVDFAYKKCS